MATKKIDRSRVDSGKVQLPKKLAFLTTEKVDYLSVTDRDGDFTVELPLAALAKLIKGRAELKALKADQKTAGKTHGDALAVEKAAHAETQSSLAKAERKVKSLTKAATPVLAPAPSPAPAASAVAPSKPTTPAKAKKAAKPLEAWPSYELKLSPAPKAPAEAMDSAATVAAAPLATSEPQEPPKAVKRRAVAKAAEAALPDTVAPPGPMH